MSLISETIRHQFYDDLGQIDRLKTVKTISGTLIGLAGIFATFPSRFLSTFGLSPVGKLSFGFTCFHISMHLIFNATREVKIQQFALVTLGTNIFLNSSYNTSLSLFKHRPIFRMIGVISGFIMMIHSGKYKEDNNAISTKDLSAHSSLKNKREKINSLRTSAASNDTSDKNLTTLILKTDFLDNNTVSIKEHDTVSIKEHFTDLFLKNKKGKISTWRTAFAVTAIFTYLTITYLNSEKPAPIFGLNSERCILLLFPVFIGASIGNLLEAIPEVWSGRSAAQFVYNCMKKIRHIN